MPTLYYDIETDSEHPAYANMTLMGILEESWTNPLEPSTEKIHVWEAPWTEEKIEEIKSILCEGGVTRVGFNNLNFDDLVLHNHGIAVPEEGTEDAYLAIKTCLPGLPAHGLKFLLWYLMGDPSWDEYEMRLAGHKFGDTPTAKLKKYHRADLERHRKIWNYIKDTVALPKHQEAYRLDMAMKFPLQEMIFTGGVLVDTKKAEVTLAQLEEAKDKLTAELWAATGGKITNPRSNQQVGDYLAQTEDWGLSLTAGGDFQVKKTDLADINGMSDEEMRNWTPAAGKCLLSPVALATWRVRDNETLRKYVKNYLTAAIETKHDGWIPSSYSISRASTRRTLSKSYYKINFQNSTEAIDEFKLIPKGYIGCFIDSTQIENVVHIYESEDWSRRAAYEADENWNEYVWLCNEVLGTLHTKQDLENTKSKLVPHWSVYKAYKTAKLSLNFGQGAKAFSERLGFKYDIGKEIFKDIHRACPAIKRLQAKVEALLERDKFVQDVFGHIYTGPIEEAYKVVAYLIQGCGTGSLPKAQLRANWETLQNWSQTMNTEVGYLVCTTHDEQGMFIRNDLGEEAIKCIIEEFYVNMTSKFDHKFDNIPLRGKLYLTNTNWKNRKYGEIPINQLAETLTKYI